MWLGGLWLRSCGCRDSDSLLCLESAAAPHALARTPPLTLLAACADSNPVGDF
jgi:hypothetical protein